MKLNDSLPLTEFAQDVWDVVVVGAGPAGAMAAHGLSRHGLKVLLVDRAAFPRRKVCGCCLNPCTLNILVAAGLGELAAQCCAAQVHEVHLAAAGNQAKVGLSGWRVLSRERLDYAMVEAAKAGGAAFLPATHATLGAAFADRRMVRLRRGGEQAEIGARLILAADGLGSQLLQGEPGCAVLTAPSSRVGAGVVAEVVPEAYRPGIIYMAYGAGGYVGLVRLEDGKLNIAAALEVDFLRKLQNPGKATAQILREAQWPPIPDLAELPWQGTPCLTRQSVRPASERVVAIGDAGGYIEPFTGEGIGWALASGVAVVPFAVSAVRQWQPTLTDEWTALQSRNKARSWPLIRAVAWLSRRPTLARGLIGLVGRVPWVVAPFVNRISKRR